MMWGRVRCDCCAVCVHDTPAGKLRRASGKRNALFRLKTYKKVYVRIDDGPAAPAAPAAKGQSGAQLA